MAVRPANGHKRVVTTEWLQTIDYKRLITNDCLQTIVYKRLITNDWLQTVVYKRLFTNEWLQSDDQPKVGIGPGVPITFGGPWSRIIRTGIAYSNNFTATTPLEFVA